MSNEITNDEALEGRADARQSTWTRPWDVPTALRRHWLLPVVGALVLGLLGAVFAARSAPTFVSSAEVLLRPIVGNPYNPDTAVNASQTVVAMETEAVMASAPEVATLVTSAVPAATAPERGLGIAVEKNTQVLTVTYRSGSAEQAQLMAGAWAEAVLDRRAALATQAKDGELTVLRAQLEEAQKALTAATSAAGGQNPSADAVARVQLAVGRVDDLQERVSTIEARDTNAGQIVGAATAPGSSTDLPGWLYVLLGTLAGLLLGLVAAILRERSDDAVRVTDAGRIGGVPVLATFLDPEPPVRREAVHRLRTAVVASHAPGRVIAVAPVAPTASALECSHSVARGLAAAMHQSGRRVTMVDAAGVQTSGASIFDPADGTAVPQGSAPKRELEVMSVSQSRTLSDMLASHALEERLNALAAERDVVVVSSTAAGLASGMDTIRQADAVVLSVEPGLSTHSAVADAATVLERLGSHVIGVVTIDEPLTDTADDVTDDVTAAPAAYPAAEEPVAGRPAQTVGRTSVRPASSDPAAEQGVRRSGGSRSAR